MRILLVNTSAGTGGAAIAASRLMKALNDNGHLARMLVAGKDVDSICVVAAQSGIMRTLRFLLDRLVIFLHLFSRKGLFDIDSGAAGCDITRTDEFREADVVHVHWINQGMMSLSSLGRLLDSGKPVVFTMHDMWYMTGLCHYAHECSRWQDAGCSHCPLRRCSNWAGRVWRRKHRILSGNVLHHPVFVGCSEWMAGLARRSGLLGQFNVMAIPNTIDTHVFCPSDGDTRSSLGLPTDKRVILFAAQKVTDPRKGMALLIEALQKVDSRDTVVAVLGGKAEAIEGQIPQRVYALGYQSGPHRIADVYRAADVFVTPSLSDNLPNTIMEAMACGVPCVGFRVGGIPEMIDHTVNGYVATPSDTADLACGIANALKHRTEYSAEAVRKVHKRYAPDHVANLYLQAYEQAARPVNNNNKR